VRISLVEHSLASARLKGESPWSIRARLLVRGRGRALASECSTLRALRIFLTVFQLPSRAQAKEVILSRPDFFEIAMTHLGRDDGGAVFAILAIDAHDGDVMVIGHWR